LRAILTNTLADCLRRFQACGRNVGQERSLAAEHSSPDEQAMRQEQLLRIAEALAQLPEDQRRAVELRHLKGCKVAEVVDQMGRSKEAVAKLLMRGVARLRSLLDEGRKDKP
jgi:RNA polymerase sigma-70 factor (ECF subfamily)